jgi:xanthine dehydrogenase large subunit
MPEQLNVTLFAQATEDGAVYGSKAVGEPPFMLAFSVREALRQAVGAFGPSDGYGVELASPATPEAVFWAIEAAIDARCGTGVDAAEVEIAAADAPAAGATAREPASV